MPSPHAGFAAVTVLSEELLNRCLNTYLNAIVAGLPPLRIRRSSQGTIAGSLLTFSLSTGAVLLSVQVTLKKNANSRIYANVRFFGSVEFDVSSGVSSTPINSYSPEVLIDVALTTSLISRVHEDQFQFGLDLANCSLNAVHGTILSHGGVPPAYQAQLLNVIHSPITRSLLDAYIRGIAANSLLATPTTVPAVYHFSMNKPYQQNERWFEGHIAAGRLICWPLDGALAVAIDVPGYTFGVVTDVYDFRSRGYKACDMASATNLDFIQAFLKNVILPQMKDAFVPGRCRINSVKRVDFKTQQMVNGLVNFIESEFECSYWTRELVHSAISGTTEISGIEVIVPAHPYLVDGRILFRVGMIQADLPTWIDVLVLGLSTLLPPVSLFLPAIITTAVHNAVVDVANMANKRPHEGGLLVRHDSPLPGTSAPQYRFDPVWFILDCRADERVALAGATMRSVSQPTLKITMPGQRTQDIGSGTNDYYVRRDGGLPLSIKAILNIPRNLLQTNDPTLRVRFETYLNGNAVQAYTRDLRLSGTFLSAVSATTVRPTELNIDTIQIVSPQKLDQEIRISCRLYRSWGGATQDLFNATAYIASVDPRPDSVKPYVQWAHWVKYWNGFKTVRRIRRSKIHRAPGKGGCRFSNQYLLPGMNSAKFVSLRRFTGLPFDIRHIEANRKLVCPYCFFGGPDKHGIEPFQTKVDITGTVGKVFNP